jgi:hypothetical protein
MTAASSVSAPLTLINAIVTQNSLQPLEAIEKRLEGTLTLDERVSITGQLNIVISQFCLAEATQMRFDQMPKLLSMLIMMFEMPLMKTITPPTLAFDNDQIRLRLTVVRVAWGVIAQSNQSSKTMNAEGLTYLPIRGYSTLRGTDCTIALSGTEPVSMIDFTKGCLNPAKANQLRIPVLTLKDMHSGVTLVGTVIFEHQTLMLGEQKGHYRSLMIQPTAVVTSFSEHLAFMPKPLITLVQSYLVPTIQPTSVYLTISTGDFSYKRPYLFPYAPQHITSANATASSDALTVTVSDTVDAAVTFPWIQGEIDRFKDEGQSPRLEGEWIAHDKLWVIACILLMDKNVIILSHPNMGCALSYTAKEGTGFSLAEDLGATSGHINPEQTWAEQTSLVEAFATFASKSK